MVQSALGSTVGVLTEVIAVGGRRVMLNLGNGKYQGFFKVPQSC